MVNVGKYTIPMGFNKHFQAIDGEWECACDYFRNGNVIFVPMKLRGAKGHQLMEMRCDQSVKLMGFLQEFQTHHLLKLRGCGQDSWTRMVRIK